MHLLTAGPKRDKALCTRASRRACALALGAASLVGCTGDDTNPAIPDAGVRDGASSDATAAAPADAGADAGSRSTRAGIRVAHWSPDAPAVDFCLAPHGGHFESPVLGALLAAADGGETPDSGAPLAFPSVSAYIPVAPGAYDVRVVAGGAPDCAAGVALDLTSFAPLASGALATVALIGVAHPGPEGTQALALLSFSDDSEPADAGAIGLRVVNAAPLLPSAAFGTGRLGAGFSALFASVPFAKVGAALDGGALDASRVLDSNGYKSLGALSGVTLSAHGAGATVDAVVATNVFAAAGGLLTFVLVDVGGPQPGARMLECVDNAGTVGLAAACSLLGRP